MGLGDNIRFHMKEREMTSGMLAYQMKVHANTVCRWIRGETEPGARALLRLSRILGVTMEELMEDET